MYLHMGGRCCWTEEQRGRARESRNVGGGGRAEAEAGRGKVGKSEVRKGFPLHTKHNANTNITGCSERHVTGQQELGIQQLNATPNEPMMGVWETN